MTPRIKALATLHQVETRALEALARELNAAQSAQLASQARIEALGQRAATEARCTSMEALPYVGRFMASLRREQSRENLNCQQLEGQIEGLRDQVISHYSAGRNWETLSDRLTAEILAAREKKAEAGIEDMTMARFGR